MKNFKKISCISFLLLLFSCSDDQDFVSHDMSESVVVEMVSSQCDTPRNTKSISSDKVQEATYNIKYRNILMENISLTPYYASKLMSAKSMSDVQYLTLRGYTSIEPNENGRKGGDTFACVFGSEGAQKFGMPAGTYMCRDVYFVNRYQMETEDFAVKQNGTSTSENMGYLPGQKPTPGFKLSKVGRMIECKTEGTLIIATTGGVELNKSYPVLAENMVFDLKYVIVDF